MAPFSELLRRPTPLLGTIVTSHDPALTEALSHSGVDWLFFDTEHAPLSIAHIHDLIRATAGRCASIVRIAHKADETSVKHMLDSGCDGIIIPAVTSAAEVMDVVRWAKYPPQGLRSVGISRAHTYGLTFNDHIANANRTTSVIIQIENASAVAAIDAIVNVAGIDGIFIGPYDLSASMGHIGEITHPDVVAAMQRVKDAASEKQLPVGIFVNNPDAAVAQLIDGIKFIAVGIDIGIILQAVRTTIERIKSA